MFSKPSSAVKETEIGTIPKGWENFELEKFADITKDGYLSNGDDSLPYIGLEHIDQQTLSLNSIGKSSDVTSNKFRFRSGGTRMPRADWNYLKYTIWPVPKLQEKKQIAEILSSLDDKIELNRKINANLEKLAAALFKKWFVDIGDELPEEWRMGKLGEEFEIIRAS